MKRSSRFPNNYQRGKNQLKNKKLFKIGRSCPLLRQRQGCHNQFNNLLALGRGIQFLLSVQGRQKEKMIIFNSGLLAGYRNTDGSFNNRGTNANIWSSLESGTNAWRRNLNSGNATVNRNANNKLYGFSVRCIKDWFNLTKK